MVLGEDGSLRRGALHDREQRGTLAAGVFVVGRNAARLQDCRVGVDMSDRDVTRRSFRDVLPRHDPRHACGFLVHRRLAPEPAGPNVVAVIAGVHDARRVHQLAFAQARDNLSDVVVEKADEPVIGGDGDTHLFLVEEFVVGETTRVVLQVRMIGAFAFIVLFRPGHLIERIEVKELRRRHQREMGTDV